MLSTTKLFQAPAVRSSEFVEIISNNGVFEPPSLQVGYDVSHRTHITKTLREENELKSRRRS